MSSLSPASGYNNNFNPNSGNGQGTGSGSPSGTGPSNPNSTSGNTGGYGRPSGGSGSSNNSGGYNIQQSSGPSAQNPPFSNSQPTHDLFQSAGMSSPSSNPGAFYPMPQLPPSNSPIGLSSPSPMNPAQSAIGNYAGPLPWANPSISMSPSQPSPPPGFPGAMPPSAQVPSFSPLGMPQFAPGLMPQGQNGFPAMPFGQPQPYFADGYNSSSKDSYGNAPSNVSGSPAVGNGYQGGGYASSQLTSSGTYFSALA